MNNRLINTKVAGGGGGCTDIVDNYDPFGGNGVALYQLNGNATDESGNYNGTAYNVTYGTGVFGQAVAFNGTSTSKITTNLSVNTASSFSISAWIKSDLDNTWQTWGFCGNTDNDALFLQKRGDDNRLRFIIYDGGVVLDMNSLEAFPTGQWYHFAATINGSVGNLYINGVNVANNVSYTHSKTYSNFTFGQRPITPSEFFDGSLDQIRIFNEALTPLEVEALYTEELCICDGTVDTLDILGDGSCIATYQLDGNANDLSGNYSGTPTNVSYGVGEFDLASLFASSTSKINIPQTYGAEGEQFSYSLWFKTSVANGSYMFAKRNGNNTFHIRIDNSFSPAGKICVNNWAGTAQPENNAQSTNGGYNDNTWHNFVFTYDGTRSPKTQCYIDGQRDTNMNWDYDLFTQSVTNGNNIGNFDINGANFSGSIDQVRIFNKALSAGEVTTLYNETACTKETRTAGVTQILGDSSCIAYYKLDGTAIDETGSYNGTFTSPDYRNGEFDLAANFNGINGEIALSNAGTTNLNLDGDFSISIWVKPLGVNAQGIYQFIYGSGVKEFGITYDPVVQRGGAYFWTGSAVASVGGDIPLSNWSNIVFSRSKTTGMKFYINNSLVDSDSFTGNGATISSAYDALGQWGRPSIDRYFKGQLDNIRFFNKAVSASEVTTLYNEGI